MAAFLTAAAAAIGSSSIGGALVRILVAYGISRLINSATGNTNTPEAIDQGIRLQVGPDTTNTIPVLYGSAYMGGKITDAQITDANKTMWYCLTLAENPSTATRLSDSAAITATVDEVYWNNQRVYFKADGITIDYLVNQDGVVDTSPRDLVKIYLYNGSSGPIRPSDLLEYLPSLPALHGDARTLMPGWVSDERMFNLTFALVKISYNRDKGITGLPELQFKVSNNLFRPGDAIYSFLRNTISGAGLSSSQIDTASLVALNGYADDTVSYYDEDDGQTKTLANRYQINGIVNSAEIVMSNLQKLAGNAGCFINYDIATGLWGVTINKNESPVLAFDDSNIISGIDLTGTNLDSMYNAVEVEFPHRQLRDQRDTIRIDLPEEYRNDNEPDNILQLKFDLINEPLQARELGYLELYQNRMDQVVTFTTDYSKINTEAGDVITVSTSVYNWTNKPFRVVRVREVESAEGGLAVEITAQEYDSTMYTAGGVPRRPRVPTEPIAIPDIAVIGTPAAPTVVQINNVAVPALDITGLTPAGIVDRFEYWYSTDAGTTYKVLGSRANSNGSPYTQSTSLTFRAASLPAGSYLFKVRGGNENAFGEFSPASTSVAWAPVQVTDQVTASTTVGGGLSDLIGPLAMGAIAYFAYQALYPEIMKALGDTAVGAALGIPSSAIQNMKNAAGNFKLVQVGDSIQTPYNNDTITFIAGGGIEITAVANDGTITISANGETTAGVTKIIAGEGIAISPTTGLGDVTISITGGGGGTGPVDSGGASSGNSYVLNGSVFPNKYEIDGVYPPGDKPAIFTHTNMVISNSAYGNVIKPQNVVLPDTILTPVLTVTPTDVVPGEPPAEITYDTDQFTGGPSTASTDTAAEAAARAQAVAKANQLLSNTWTETSFNEVKIKLNDNGTYTATYILRVQYPSASPPSTDTRTDNYRYYSTCTYNSALGLPQQAWSAWKKWKEPVTQTTQVLSGSTNPPIPATTGYIVDGEYTPGGVGLKTGNTGDAFYYDYFLPDTPTYTTKTVTVDNQIVKCEPGQMVAFGVCNRDLGDTVAFATNTIFGVETSSYVDSPTTSVPFPNYVPGNKYVTNGSRWVAPHPWYDDILYWSNDSIVWNKVKDVTFLDSATTDQSIGIFGIIPYNSTVGKFIAYRRNLTTASLAYSSDGINWTETGKTIPGLYSSSSNTNIWYINNVSKEYIFHTTSSSYLLYSHDGINWYIVSSSLLGSVAGTGWNSPMSAINAEGLVQLYDGKWLVPTTLNWFTLSPIVANHASGTFTFGSGVQSIQTYSTPIVANRPKPTNLASQNTVRNKSLPDSAFSIRTNRVDSTPTIIPVNATTFYVLSNNYVKWETQILSDGQSEEAFDFVDIKAYYTISGTTITAADYSNQNITAPTPIPNLPALTSLPNPSLPRTIKSSAPIAYATTYNYPGVAGTPIIYRAGDYGVGAYSNSVSLKTTYSTA